MTKFEFQPFDKVLVRDSDQDVWSAAFYSHRNNRIPYPNRMIGDIGWAQCIPYNETTKHLCGISDPYIDPAEAPAFEFGDVVEVCSSEFVGKGIFLYPVWEDKNRVCVIDQSGVKYNCREKQVIFVRKGNFND